MPDIREILNGLDEEDQRLYSKHRTHIRGAYLQCLTEALGINNHDETDDAFLDWIDIKVALIFDRAGRFAAAEGKIDVDRSTEIEKDIMNKIGELTKKQFATLVEASDMTTSQQVLNATMDEKDHGVHTANNEWPKS